MTGRTRAGLLIAVGLLVVGGSACGDDGGDEETAGLDPDAPRLAVSMTEYRYDPAPIEATVATVLEVSNDGGLEHNLLVQGEFFGTPDLPAGDSAPVDLSRLEPGEYTVFCDIDDHRERGMETTLTVE